MQWGLLFRQLIEWGIEADPRSAEAINASLQKSRQAWEASKDRAVQMAHDQQWANPYGDSRILYGDEAQEIRRVLVGIDIDGAELLLADRWRAQGKAVDGVIAHHPEGRGLVQLAQVMKVQEDLLIAAGVPVNVAEGLLQGRMNEVRRSLLGANHQKVVDLARCLEIPFLCVHSPADNQVYRFLTNYLTEERLGPVGSRQVEDVINALLDLPEFQLAAQHGMVPQVTAGKNKDRAGKLYIKMNGGTSGPDGSIEALAQAGVGTIVCMHLPEAQRKKAAEMHLRVIIAGHMACDSLGLNLLMDRLEEQGVEVVPCGGFLRHRRVPV
ncbi:NGG1p interacting factor NIF3 [Heliophilum fasciatum]|uniref:Putative NIF3 family GTP cyclohydrolase 1 type 2 n=1 Tax=Heliophilum fasciatum TaxID=35700 RepID=A0A4R2RUX3_9FIRM|nr:NGG1p interacting factor NIF3 [Heliophilum fasciatum]MCW2277195.1 putative NIF3 family GTP cyclohydrolase 1 type 2 [Heliophilum fasciatum]TCP68170.1 putative NIF3 family GTP cyclohydrolase 1 type 2 [Heliophilum fasciatum]